MALFASVFLFVAAAAVDGAWMLFSTNTAPSFNNAKTDARLPSPAGLVARQVVGCPAQPIAAMAGDKDGRFPMQADESGLIAADIPSFLVLGQAASAAGRVRDADVALLMSCRIADKLKGSASVESADARYQLGLHYTELALHEGLAGAANRPELRARAEALYADSLLAYAARFGDCMKNRDWRLTGSHWRGRHWRKRRGPARPHRIRRPMLICPSRLKNHQVLRDPTQQPPRRHSALCLPRAAKQKSCRLL